VKRIRSKSTLANRDVPRPGGLVGAVLATMLIGGLVAAGCGSSNNSSTSSTASTAAITKAEFVTKANAICAKGNKQTNAAGAKLGKNPSKAQFTAYVKNTAVPSIQTQINGVRALGAPSRDQATVTKMLDLAQADLNKVKSNPGLLGGKTDAFADFAKIAHPYGLKACDPSS
jgi:hypothetical protein